MEAELNMQKGKEFIQSINYPTTIIVGSIRDVQIAIRDGGVGKNELLILLSILIPEILEEISPKLYTIERDTERRIRQKEEKWKYKDGHKTRINYNMRNRTQIYEILKNETLQALRVVIASLHKRELLMFSSNKLQGVF